MKKIIGQLKSYLSQLDHQLFIPSVLFLSIFIFCNYHFGIEKMLRKAPETKQYFSWFFIFLLSFSFPYLLKWVLYRNNTFNRRFFVLLLLAPAIFAWKISADTHFNFSVNSQENTFWNLVAYWPAKLLIVSLGLFIIWRLFDKQQAFYGLNRKGFEAKPYFLMLLIMVPLIAFASTQQDFLSIYPKLKNISFLKLPDSGWHRLLYELSYGSDFITIELFFRGFLVLAFAKWAGKDVILPMALFYCTIHFGKPLAECISSFFGGIILGVITYYSKSIYGGLLVHLGIAWLMELGGHLGSQHILNMQ